MLGHAYEGIVWLGCVDFLTQVHSSATTTISSTMNPMRTKHKTMVIAKNPRMTASIANDKHTQKLVEQPLTKIRIIYFNLHSLPLLSKDRIIFGILECVCEVFWVEPSWFNYPYNGIQVL